MELQELLNKIPDKQYSGKSTTSRLWKSDVYNFFQDKPSINVLELGTHSGWTAYMLSYIFDNVYTVEIDSKYHQLAKDNFSHRSNINFIKGDVYKDITYEKPDFPKYFDAVVIDCVHTYGAVKADIKRALKYAHPDKGIYLIFDDYSHPKSESSHRVKNAINDSVKEGLKVEKYIGQGEGYTIHRNNGTSVTLIGPEGIILSNKI